MAIVCFTLMSTEIPIKFVIYHAAFFAVIEHEANCRIMIYADLCWHQQKFLPKLWPTIVWAIIEQEVLYLSECSFADYSFEAVLLIPYNVVAADAYQKFVHPYFCPVIILVL